MVTKSQLSTTEPKKQKQEWTKQTARTGTDSQKWRSHGGLSVVWGTRENGGEGTGNKKRIWLVCNRERERERLRIVWEMEKPKNLYVWPMDIN